MIKLNIHNEGLIAKHDKFNIIVIIHSNEKKNHNIPHVHIKFKDKELIYDFCNMKFIKGENLLRANRKNAIINLINENLDKIKSEWYKLPGVIKV